MKGSLLPADRPVTVNIIFKCEREINVENMPLIICHVIEPYMGNGGETIAQIPLRVNAKSVFSVYKVIPSSDINFGPMVLNSKKTKTITIENKGMYPFSYLIQKHEVKNNRLQALKDKEARENRGSGVIGTPDGREIDNKPMKGGRNAQLQSREGRASKTSSSNFTKGGTTGNQNNSFQTTNFSTHPLRQAMGNFVINPSHGTIQAGQQAIVTIDCSADSPFPVRERLAIDITDRNPIDHPGGIPYKLFAEGCIPQINTNPESVFEEHQIVHSLSHFNRTLFNGVQPLLENTKAVFGINENKLFIPSALVGQNTKIRLKIQNNNKVPCENVLFTMKPLSNKSSHKINDIFEVEPARAQIPAYGHVMVTCTFCPPSIGQYQCHFEANVDGINIPSDKPKRLTFEILAESSLPQVQVSELHMVIIFL